MRRITRSIWVAAAFALAPSAACAFGNCDSAEAALARWDENVPWRRALAERKFAEVDKYLNGLLAEHAAGRISDADVDFILDAVVVWGKPGEELYDEWAKAFPSSEAARLAHGYGQYVWASAPRWGGSVDQLAHVYGHAKAALPEADCRYVGGLIDHELGVVHFARNDFERAALSLERGMAECPGLSNSSAQAMDLYMKQRDFPRLASFYENAVGGVQRDLHKAIDLYDIAHEKGVKGAREKAQQRRRIAGVK